jgi:putative Mn2+ efflux pump MntP
MSFISLFFISVGLAMDAFAVSLTEGIKLKKIGIKNILRIAIIFGLFQGGMPFLGWKVGSLFYDMISKYSNFVGFILLFSIGVKMILDAREVSEESNEDDKINENSNIILLGIATSIDALAVGFSFSLIPNLNIYSAIVTIGSITFLLSSFGVILGNKVGQLLGSKAEYLGGIILILMGIIELFS